MDAVMELNPRLPVGVQAREFAVLGDPMAPGACKWCGATLGAVKLARTPKETPHMDARGDYGDNAFCGLRCGYMFGVQMAIIGHRLRIPKPCAP